MPKTRMPGKRSPQKSPEQTLSQAEAIKPLVWGFFVSLLMAILPIRLIIRGIFSLGMMLVRPVFLFLGLMKAYEEFNRCQKSKSAKSAK
jgi:hypothetical protein